MKYFATVTVVLGALAATAHADPAYLLPHPEDARWWLSAQGNVIMQAQPGFHSPYETASSFRDSDHLAVSLVGTVYGGLELTPTTAIVITGESAGGGGLSDALGIAGFTNLDVVRNPTLGPTPYVGRAYIEQDLPLGPRVHVDRDPLHALRTRAEKRFEFRAGKLSTADWFDVNPVGTDSHLQFMNWSVDNNAAWDYAADTRGYTLGATVTYVEPRFSLRLGEMLMPTVANGIDYDFHVHRARGENLEFEVHGKALAGRDGTARVLGFWNHAAMGNYREAIDEYRTGNIDVPDITRSREAGRSKAGFGVNVDQDLPDHIRAFARVGWNDGENESFAYTEVDNTAEVGGDIAGTAWGRAHDRIGLAAVTNGISRDHREYLALGGHGFLLGDGKLSYGREDIVEAYYTAHAIRGVFPAVDVQLVEHPGYNTDRGPVVVGSLRLQVTL